MACSTAVSLKPTLLLAPCPEGLFPFSHPATWTGLRHTERERRSFLTESADSTSSTTTGRLNRGSSISHQVDLHPSGSVTTSDKWGESDHVHEVVVCCVFASVKWVICWLCCVWFKGCAATRDVLYFGNKGSFHKSIIPYSLVRPAVCSPLNVNWSTLLLFKIPIEKKTTKQKRNRRVWKHFWQKPGWETGWMTRAWDSTSA